MVDIGDIPAEVRWEIAAKSATSMPFAYSIFFRKVVGDRFEEIVKQIWVEGGKEAKGLAQKLKLPTGNAKDVDDTWGILSLVLYGPEIKWETVEGGENRAVDMITSCPFLNRAKEMGLEPKDLFGGCQAYSRSMVENLNPKYTQRFASGMCLGAPYCESIVELKE